MEVKAEKATLTYVDLNTIGDTTQARSIFAIPPNSYVLHVGGRIVTAFTGGVTSPTVKVGDNKKDDYFIFSQPIDVIRDFIPGVDINQWSFCKKLGASYWRDSHSGDRIIATFTSSSGNFETLTAGEIEFFIVYAV